MHRGLAIGLAVMLASGSASAGEAEVIGAGMLAVDGQPVRLLGVAPPGPSEMCPTGYDASASDSATCLVLGDRLLQTLVAGTEVRCEGIEGPRFGDSVIATCFAAGVDLGRELVMRGLARVDHHYSSRYMIEQAQARRLKRGLWQNTMEAGQ